MYGNINNQDFHLSISFFFSMMKRLIVGQVSSGQDKQKLVVYFSLDK